MTALLESINSTLILSNRAVIKHLVTALLESIYKVCLRRQRPSPLEYLSYNFCFLCFLAGPPCTYKEYQDFITGSNFTSAKLENPNQFALVSDKLLLNVMRLLAIGQGTHRRTIKFGILSCYNWPYGFPMLWCQ